MRSTPIAIVFSYKKDALSVFFFWKVFRVIDWGRALIKLGRTWMLLFLIQKAKFTR